MHIGCSMDSYSMAEQPVAKQVSAHRNKSVPFTWPFSSAGSGEWDQDK